MNKKNILIAEEDAAVALSLQFLLEEEEYQTTLAKNVEEIIFYIQKQEFDLVLLDMNYDLDTTSGQEGLMLIDFILERHPALPVVAMTGWSSIELSVDAIKKGAGDFIEKPWKNERLLSIVRNQIALSESRKETEKLSTVNEILKGMFC